MGITKKFIIFWTLLIIRVNSIIISSADRFQEYQFDFLILGGGTAGIALASRLSDNRDYAIGVIDSGEYLKDDPMINTPMKFPQMIFNPKYDHMFPEVPQPKLNNGSRVTVRGKILGGSSSINFQVWSRASKEEYDALANFTGDDSWSWNGLMQFFKRSESYTPPSEDAALPGIKKERKWGLNYLLEKLMLWKSEPGNSKFHGKNGPVQITHNPPFFRNIIHPFVETVNSAGIHTNSEPDGGNITGIWDSPLSVDRNKGIRMSSVTAYLEPIVNRTNLIVLTSAKVRRLILRGTGEPFRAIGVEFISNDTKHTISARKEIIISAGSIQTPQILEYSGIGSQVVLGKYGVKSLVNLPGVGENLQDHLCYTLIYTLKSGYTNDFDKIRIDPSFASEQRQLYETNRTGIYTATWSTVLFSSLQNAISNESLSELLRRLDIELASREQYSSPLSKEQFKTQRRWLKEGRITQFETVFGPGGIFGPRPNMSYITLLISNLHPFSRGSVHISSNDPSSVPHIDFKHLDFDFDAKVLVKAAQFLHRIMSSAPIADIVDTLVFPGADISDENIAEEYLRNTALTIQHPIGTSALAPRSLGGVVDTQLKVYGLSNVRVVDASVIPFQMSMQPQATVYAIAEKAADMILRSAMGRDEF